MATVPGQLIWEIVKKNNSFLVKEFGNGTQSVQFSKEPNNLYNLNSYKHSGLANKKTVTIQPAGKDQSVLLATTKSKKQGKPASLLHKSILKKEFYRMAKAVINQVADNYYRPDLKKAALARLSAVNRSLKVSKSGVKKKNRQASKIREEIRIQSREEPVRCSTKVPFQNDPDVKESVRFSTKVPFQNDPDVKESVRCSTKVPFQNDLDVALSKEVAETIRLGAALGINLDDYEDMVREAIIEEGIICNKFPL